MALNQVQPPGRVLEQELLAQVRNSRAEPGMAALKRLLEIRLQAADRSLRRCPSTDFAAAQARAALYEDMIKELWSLPGQPAQA